LRDESSGRAEPQRHEQMIERAILAPSAQRRAIAARRARSSLADGAEALSPDERTDPLAQGHSRRPRGARSDQCEFVPADARRQVGLPSATPPGPVTRPAGPDHRRDVREVVDGLQAIQVRDQQRQRLSCRCAGREPGTAPCSPGGSAHPYLKGAERRPTTDLSQATSTRQLAKPALRPGLTLGVRLVQVLDVPVRHRDELLGRNHVLHEREHVVDLPLQVLPHQLHERGHRDRVE